MPGAVGTRRAWTVGAVDAREQRIRTLSLIVDPAGVCGREAHRLGREVAGCAAAAIRAEAAEERIAEVHRARHVERRDDPRRVRREGESPGERGGQRGTGKGDRARRRDGRRSSTHGTRPAKDAHETLGCQLTNAPFGLSFHAQTCSV